MDRQFCTSTFAPTSSAILRECAEGARLLGARLLSLDAGLVSGPPAEHSDLPLAGGFAFGAAGVGASPTTRLVAARATDQLIVCVRFPDSGWLPKSSPLQSYWRPTCGPATASATAAQLRGAPMTAATADGIPAQALLPPALGKEGGLALVRRLLRGALREFARRIASGSAGTVPSTSRIKGNPPLPRAGDERANLSSIAAPTLREPPTRAASNFPRHPSRLRMLGVVHP